MKKILAFAGSNHSNSINYQLLEYAGSLIDGLEVKVLDIRDWDVPMYSLNLEADPTPERIAELIGLIQEYDGFMIASPEHNGGTPAFLKNILDWMSRKAKQVFEGKPVLFLSTSPGATGGANNLKYLSHALSYQGATSVGTYSLPSFQNNFVDGQLSAENSDGLKEQIQNLTGAINE